MIKKAIYKARKNKVIKGVRRSATWNVRECILFMELQPLYQNHWKQIQPNFPTKNEFDIKNHFYSIIRNSIQHIIRSDFNFHSQLSIVHCYYSISYVVDYFVNHPNGQVRNYLQTLTKLSNLTASKSISYQAQFVQRYKVLEKVGWKAYCEESQCFPNSDLDRYGMPNRILPELKNMAGQFLNQEDTLQFAHSWISQAFISYS